MAEENGCVSPADETTCFIGRWGNVKYSTRCYYFSLFWLRNQLKLVSLCFMYHDDDDVPVLHDFIRFHYQYPAFLQRYRSSLKTGPAWPGHVKIARDITHQRQQHIVTFRHLDTIILLPFVYWKRYLWSRLAPPTNLVNWSKRSDGLFERSLRRLLRLVFICCMQFGLSVRVYRSNFNSCTVIGRLFQFHVPIW